MWADHVIVADQGSTDGTLELLQSTRDVETIINAAKTYDERHRQRLLVDKAREIPGKRILICARRWRDSIIMLASNLPFEND